MRRTGRRTDTWSGNVPPVGRHASRFLVGVWAASLLFWPYEAVEGTQDTILAVADNRPTWGESPRLVEELRIGKLEGDAEFTFGGVRGLAVLETGEIWVLDGPADVVRRFDPNGQHLGNVGGSGSGPGEFTSPMDIFAMPDERIATWDSEKRRVTLFFSDGTLSTSFNVEEAATPAMRPALRVDSSLRFYILSTDFKSEFWIRTNLEGEVLDTLPIPPPDKKGTPSAGQFYASGPMLTYPHQTLSFLSPKGTLVVGRNDEYALHQPLQDGRILRIERSWDPVPVKREERRAFQIIEDHYSDRNGKSAVRIPREKPPWWRLWVDEEDRIWVARHVEGYHRPESDMERSLRERWDNPPNEWWEPPSFDVIERNGEFLGRIEFVNPQTILAAARGAHIWVVESGRYDEHYVVRYRIVPDEKLRPS